MSKDGRVNHCQSKITPEGMTLMAGYVFNCGTLNSVSALSAPAVEPWTFGVQTEVVTARPAKTPLVAWYIF